MHNEDTKATVEGTQGYLERRHPLLDGGLVFLEVHLPQTLQT